jgi:hypothetical protein
VTAPLPGLVKTCTLQSGDDLSRFKGWQLGHERGWLH